MPKYMVRDADSYGHSMGVLMLEYRSPFIPGDVGNASSYGYPVLFKVVEGLTFERVLAADPDAEAGIVEAARELERFGVKGISSDCGFMIQFQRAVAGAVKVPVFMSSLLQLPFLSMTFDPDRPVGCITATRKSLGNRVLELAGVRSDMQVVIRGMEDRKHFKEQILGQSGELDSDEIEEEVVEEAVKMVEDHPDMGAIVLECSLLPPYSSAVQKATGLPVFDFITMINYFHEGAHQKPYHGQY